MLLRSILVFHQILQFLYKLDFSPENANILCSLLRQTISRNNSIVKTETLNDVIVSVIQLGPKKYRDIT